LLCCEQSIVFVHQRIRPCDVRWSTLEITREKSMANHDEHSFRPKLKARRSTKSVSPRFISRVIKAASQAGPVSQGQVSPGRECEGGKLGRGFVQARLARHRMSATSRRVTIKMRMVVLARAGRRSTATHLKYLERDEVTPDGKRREA
jgi:hypothetical protein